MLSQTNLIKKHLQSGRSITPLQALSMYGCLRLGARIYDLKREGLDIDSHLVRQNGKQFSEYFIAKQKTHEHH
jgi:hypothetical protein